jgi:tyrosine-protein phosphatase SIW14
MKFLPAIAAVALLALVVAGPLLYRAEKHRTYRNLRTVEDGVLYRSGQLSMAGFEDVVKTRGIRTVIKLREAGEKEKDQRTDAAEEAYCKAHGIVFLRREPKDWEPDATGYVPAIENLTWFEDLIDDQSKTPRPVLIHCFAGIHRTGSLVAVYRMKYHGWSADEAVEELKECGHETSTFVGNMLPYLRKYEPKHRWVPLSPLHTTPHGTHP